MASFDAFDLNGDNVIDRTEFAFGKQRMANQAMYGEPMCRPPSSLPVSGYFQDPGCNYYGDPRLQGCNSYGDPCLQGHLDALSVQASSAQREVAWRQSAAQQWQQEALARQAQVENISVQAAEREANMRKLSEEARANEAMSRALRQEAQVRQEEALRLQKSLAARQALEDREAAAQQNERDRQVQLRLEAERQRQETERRLQEEQRQFFLLRQDRVRQMQQEAAKNLSSLQNDHMQLQCSADAVAKDALMKAQQARALQDDVQCLREEARCLQADAQYRNVTARDIQRDAMLREKLAGEMQQDIVRRQQELAMLEKQREEACIQATQAYRNAAVACPPPCSSGLPLTGYGCSTGCQTFLR